MNPLISRNITILFLLTSVYACSPKQDWKTAVFNDLLLSGRISSKEDVERLSNSRKLPANWIVIERNDLGMMLEKTGDETMGKGIQLLSLIDKNTNTVLSASKPVPLFSVELLDKLTQKTVSINAAEGWNTIEYDRKSAQFVFTGARLPEGEKMCVVLKTCPDHEPSYGINWHWQVLQNVDRYELRKLNCPQIALRDLGTTMKAFYPYASGIVTENPCGKKLNWQSRYPNGWDCSMQWTAIYDETKNTGLYIAVHDPSGSVKNMHLDATSDTNSLTVRFEHLLPLNDTMKYDAGVWQTFHGDWFDAALIYRRWMRKEALWYPRQKLGANGRTDTPQWMKELCVWAICSDPPQQMPETMRKFTDALNIPTAVHWYNWHQIPFDNDYPHYFPTKDGFKEAVAEIQKMNDCYVMPYINGRLWDTRDRGTEDFQFTSVALPAATKKEDGSPYIETYGSKEVDGSAVELAVMCPSTDVWKNKVAGNIFRLTNECGVDGVYVDQIAAAKPELCYDPSHGHPLAGGSWWNSEYWKMFEKIRSELPEQKILTTECNAETFVHVFDGYLTWHFQYQDQVPAFAAVYGGTVQMFGRSYGGDVLGGRMKMAQQLVYGEQIGWIDPRIIDDPQRFPFFRDIVHTRYKYRDYFYKGEMLRPPKLLDEIPTVTADWQWFTTSGKVVTTDAVLTGAWRKTDESGNTVSALILFVNVSDNPVTSRVAIRFDETGIQSNGTFDKPLTFLPGVPIAIEMFAK